MVNSGYRNDLPVPGEPGAASFLKIFLPAPHLQAPCLEFHLCNDSQRWSMKSVYQFAVKCRSKGQCSKSFIEQNLFFAKACPFF